jgi:hypothetical protein
MELGMEFGAVRAWEWLAATPKEEVRSVDPAAETPVRAESLRVSERPLRSVDF